MTDTGPGIAPEYHDRIFGIFQRLQARDKVEGTGIGLSLVKKIVETGAAASGCLDRRNAMEVASQDQRRRDAPGEKPPGDAPLRLLIVDDDQVDRTTVRRGLRTAGFQSEIEEAETFRGAVEALRAAVFDCVFLDFRLPGGDGLQVLREVRAAGVRTPIVMLTAQGDEQLAVELMKAGASDYLPKGSLSPERLAQSLRYALRVHQAEAQARAADAAREEAIAARGRFYAAMSHELRTPINAIIGYNDLLLSAIYGPLTDAQLGGLERAQRAARHLLELVNDVLDLSKLEAGKMDLQPEPVSIPSLIDDLFTTIRPPAEDHGCELTLQAGACPRRIETDPRRVRQILLNLLSNAIKFGPGKPVEVSCKAAEDGGIAVEVRDHGRGVDPADLPRIFEEFVQLGEGEQSGTGLGLPISKRLAKLLGGSLTAESALGKGSMFRLTLPPVLKVTEPEQPSRAERRWVR